MLMKFISSSPLEWFQQSFKCLLLAFVLQILSACSHQNIEDYAPNKPLLNIEDFFNGELVAHGIVKDRSDKVIRSFTATIDATWQNGEGTLDESFIFDDGEVQKRIWQLKPNQNGSYTASANDVVGEHPMQIAGNALFMEYVLQIPYNDSIINVSVDDKMFLVDESTIINQSLMSKWGIHLGTVQLSIRKL